MTTIWNYFLGFLACEAGIGLICLIYFVATKQPKAVDGAKSGQK